MTVRMAVPAMEVEGSVAVMVLSPVASPVVRPPDEMEAAVVSDEDQLTSAVRFFVLRSE
jgi:hypothetical protein